MVCRVLWACSCVLIASACTNANASIQTGDLVSIGNGHGSPGGIFYLKDASGTKITDTFCVQLEEFINFNSQYTVVDAYATSTLGKGSKPLTSFAAWLYDRYLNGVEGSGPALPSFDFSNVYGQTSNSAANFQANELQLAIWVAMGYTPSEIGGEVGGWYDMYDEKVAGWEAAYLSDVANNQWSGTGDVYILNLKRSDNNKDAQDQLIRHPVVPEPASLLVWLAITGVCVGLVRRASKA